MLSWLSDVNIKNEDEKENELDKVNIEKKENVDGKDDDSSSSEDENFSTLRELLIRPNKPENESPTSNGTGKSNKKSQLDRIDDVLSHVNNKVENKDGDIDMKQSELKHFVRRYQRNNFTGRNQLPLSIMTLTESKMLYPDTPHSWLCDGKLLRLLEPFNPGNYKMFQVII